MYIKKTNPKLLILSFAEFSDRLAYFGLLSVLVLYLTNHFHFSDQHAYDVFGVFTALVFTTPIIGGILTDIYVDLRLSVILGMCLVLLGSCILTMASINTLFAGISVFVCGIGFFKANNARLLGRFYEHGGDKEQAFTVLYVGMNLGAMFAPIMYGIVGAQYGLQFTFFVAVVITCLGIFAYIYMLSLDPATRLELRELGLTKLARQLLALLLVAALLIISIYQLISRASLFAHLIAFSFMIMLLVLVWLACRYYRADRNKIMFFIGLNVFSVLYFSCAFQVGSSMTLFIDRFVSRSIFGISLPTSTFVALDPMFVVIAAPLLAPIWRQLHKQSSSFYLVTLRRVLLGVLLGAFGFLVFALAAYGYQATTHVNFPLIAIVFGNFLLGAGEICIGPVIMTTVEELLPMKLRGTAMGFWYLSVAFAAYFASQLAKLTALSSDAAAIGTHGYYVGFLVSALASVLVLALGMIALFVLKRRT